MKRRGLAALMAAIYAGVTWFAIEAYIRSDASVQDIRAASVGLYGLCRMNDAYKGPIARVQRADDHSALDIGAVDDMRQFCARTICVVRTMCDQSGGGAHLNKVD